MPNSAGINVGKRKLLAKSCSQCLILQDADQFLVTGRGYHKSDCRTCLRKSSKRANKKANHHSWALATKSGMPWTMNEVKELRILFAQKINQREIAGKLGRSRQSVSSAIVRYIPKEN